VSLGAVKKVAIIGAGFVGSTTAYSLMLDGIVSEISLIDINSEVAQGHVLDLNHCMQFTKITNIVGGSSFELVKDAQIVVICAGVAQKAGESRSDLLQANAKIISKIVPEVVKYNNKCILLVVTNPLDVMTYLTWKLSGLSSCSVFGTGTVLDTARLRYFLGKQLQISPKDIVAYVLGEHGDSEFIWWSGANIAGIPLNKISSFDSASIPEIYKKTPSSSYYVKAKKGATYFAIAQVICKIIRAILLNQPRVFTVSTIVKNRFGNSPVALSLPTVIRSNGICEMLPFDLDEKEEKSLARCAGIISIDIKKTLASK